MNTFFMISKSRPDLDSAHLGANLDQGENCLWHWWDLDRPHMVRGGEAEPVGDGWHRVHRTDMPAGVGYLYYKQFGTWAEPVFPALHRMTEAEAVAWAQQYWDTETTLQPLG